MIFEKFFFLQKYVYVCVESVHLENNNKIDCKNFLKHSGLCVPIYVYCVYARLTVPVGCAGPLFK